MSGPAETSPQRLLASPSGYKKSWNNARRSRFSIKYILDALEELSFHAKHAGATSLIMAGLRQQWPQGYRLRCAYDPTNTRDGHGGDVLSALCCVPPATHAALKYAGVNLCFSKKMNRRRQNRSRSNSADVIGRRQTQPPTPLTRSLPPVLQRRRAQKGFFRNSVAAAPILPMRSV